MYIDPMFDLPNSIERGECSLIQPTPIEVAYFNSKGLVRNTDIINTEDLKNIFECEGVIYSEAEQKMIKIIKSLLYRKSNTLYTKFDRNNTIKFIGLDFEFGPEFDIDYVIK